MAYASIRKVKKNLLSEIKDEIAVHREACLIRIEAGSIEGAREQARLAISAINRYDRLKRKGLVRCDSSTNVNWRDCKFCRGKEK